MFDNLIQRVLRLERSKIGSLEIPRGVLGSASFFCVCEVGMRENAGVVSWNVYPCGW